MCIKVNDNNNRPTERNIDPVLNQMILLAVKYNVEKLVLFGSRARGDHSYLSDYDFAVFKNDVSAIDRARFNLEVEEIETLNKIDIIFMTKDLSADLLDNILKEGVLIYEQT